jgi:hypothetical protein
MRKTLILMAIFGLVNSLAICSAQDPGQPAKAQDKPAGQEPKREVVFKEVTGRVSGLSSNFIAVVYGSDDKNKASLEAAFKLDKDLRIVHKGSLKDIMMGDTVKVGFEETKETFADASTTRSVKAKTITFLQHVQKDLLPDESAQLKDTAPVEPASEGENALPLKGLKGGS